MIEAENIEQEEKSRPEINLWVSVLETAILDLGKTNEKEKRDARAWFNSNRTSDGSFIWVCGVLSFNYELTRDKILKNAGVVK